MIVIGDVHGQYDLLIKLMYKLPHDNLCFVGDLIDRGEKSKDVVELIIKNKYKCVMGNHEKFMVLSYDDNKFVNHDVYEVWEKNGGQKTINSYCKNGDINFDLFFEHRGWMKNLPLIFSYDFKTFVSHSKCLPFFNKEIDEDIKNNILWSRLHSEHCCPDYFINIHGHTITFNIFNDNGYINIDTGAYTHGKLSAYDIEEKCVYSVSECKYPSDKQFEKFYL